MDKICLQQNDGPVGIGLSVIDLYRHLYNREYQFVRKHPVKVVHPIPRMGKFGTFVAACFGGFPTAEGLDFFKHAYQEAFEATDLSVDGENLFETLKGCKTPLWMGSCGIEVRRRSWTSNPTLFFMDATQPKDLIDFWNLRALGRRILPVPRQWADQLVDPCKAFVQAQHIPLRHNPNIKQWTTLLKSRSVGRGEFDAFARQVHVQGDEALSIQHWYPRLWDDWARDKDHGERCELCAEEGETESRASGSWIAFRGLFPTFADEFTTAGKPAWANVVRIRDSSLGTELAQVLPPDLGVLDRLLDTMDFNATMTTSEGIVVLSRYQDWTHHWTLPDGFSVFHSWLKGRGFKAELSGAGRVTMQLIRSLGGPLGANLIGDADILKLLDQMAHGLVEIPSEDSHVSGKPPVRGRIVNRKTIWDLLLKANEGKKDRAERRFNSLLKRGIFRLGLELKCTQCSQRNWYGLSEIADHLRCERCLQEFSFPSVNPPKEAWSYRTQGPFSVENFAQGGYTVALAVRFLVSTSHAEATWVPSMKMIDGNGSEVEIDFGIWWRDSSINMGAPSLLLGECKSFNTFGKEDLKRARTLAESFPGATLVFATLRPSLKPHEKTRIAALARRGRKHLKGDNWRTPVMVLTSHELMSDLGPPSCWRDAGGRFAEFAKGFRGIGGLSELCDATQQLHLEMESYGEWQQRERERLRQKRHQKSAGEGK